MPQSMKELGNLIFPSEGKIQEVIFVRNLHNSMLFCVWVLEAFRLQLRIFVVSVVNFINLILTFLHIGLDKGGYPVNIFLISPQKHMLWVLI